MECAGLTPSAEALAPRGDRGPGPREGRGTGAVLRAVVYLLHEQGAGAVTRDAVAARVGVNKPAI